MTSTKQASAGGSRVTAIDVLRGLALLLLLPDLRGGFSLHALPARPDDHWLWQTLVRQMTHVEWDGAAVWDFVFPVFTLSVGAAMWYSYRSRRAAGASQRALLGHALLRSLALVLLGTTMMFKVESYVDELLPFVILAAGLPVSTWVSMLARRPLRTDQCRRIDGLVWATTLTFALLWLALNAHRLAATDLDVLPDQVLVMLGLAYGVAFCFQCLGMRGQAFAALAIVAFYGLFFYLYPVPMAHLPAQPTDVANLPAMWRNGSNAAAHFDLWLHGPMPRDPPFVLHPHGYHTLQFVPLVAIMLTGSLAGRYLAQEARAALCAGRLLLAAAIGLALGLALALAGIPIIKSIWTPSWIVCSASVSVALLALLHWACNRWRGLQWLPLIVLGSNSILLYVLAMHERWRILAIGQRLAPQDWLAAWQRPILESLWVLAVLWMIAYLLYRRRVLIRL